MVLIKQSDNLIFNRLIFQHEELLITVNTCIIVASHYK